MDGAGFVAQTGEGEGGVQLSHVEFVSKAFAKHLGPGGVRRTARASRRRRKEPLPLRPAAARATPGRERDRGSRQGRRRPTGGLPSGIVKGLEEGLASCVAAGSAEGMSGRDADDPRVVAGQNLDQAGAGVAVAEVARAKVAARADVAAGSRVAANRAGRARGVVGVVQPMDRTAADHRVRGVQVGEEVGNRGQFALGDAGPHARIMGRRGAAVQEVSQRRSYSAQPAGVVV